ncbi:MAG: WhiB family transcriptional regulator [Cytophagia bacterium]|nr:WhiB family transcriptional regulator [Cytophagia bacterium]
MADLPSFVAEVDQTWRVHAACFGMDVNIFFVDRGADAVKKNEIAKQVCRSCSVRWECLQAALEEPQPWFGIRGGLSPKERKRIRWKARDLASSPVSAQVARRGRVPRPRPSSS